MFVFFHLDFETFTGKRHFQSPYPKRLSMMHLVDSREPDESLSK